MTKTDVAVVYNLQLEIIDSDELSDAQKLQMLRKSIKKTLGEKEDNTEKMW